MPRHRQAPESRPRAHRRASGSVGRVRVRDAIAAAQTALAASRPDSQNDAAAAQDDAATAPIPAIRPQVAPRPGGPRLARLPGRPQRLRRVRARRPSAGRPPPPERPLLRGAARSLLVNPLFAAGTGFVIAAGLWIYSPHTVLRFPQADPATQLCQRAGCASDPGGTHGQLAVTTPGQQLRPRRKHKVAARAAGQGATPAAEVGFTVLWDRGGSFGAKISLPRRGLPGSWALQFELPGGAHILRLMGATLKPSADGTGITVSALPPWQYGGGGGHGYGGGGGHGYGSQADHFGGRRSVSFVFVASGSAVTPTNCQLDGASCTFGRHARR
jgi:hypothetical protein